MISRVLKGIGTQKRKRRNESNDVDKLLPFNLGLKTNKNPTNGFDNESRFSEVGDNATGLTTRRTHQLIAAFLAVLTDGTGFQ